MSEIDPTKVCLQFALQKWMKLITFLFEYYSATVEQLLAETHPQDYQQLQHELLQQQSHDQSNHRLDEQLNFAMQQTQFQSSQPMDLLMSANQSQHVSSMPSRSDDGSTMNASSMNSCQNTISNHMQSEMDQMLDIDFMQVLKCFESAPASENLGDLAGGLSLFNDMDVMNIGEHFILLSFHL